MRIPPAVRDFWDEFRGTLSHDVSERFYEAFHFDDNERDANELVELVLAGTKRATAALRWSFDAEGKPLPRPGAFSIVTNWHGAPHCIIETTQVSVVPYDAVTERFAATEGEGDKSLRHWREVHWAYFGRECARLGQTPSPKMPVVCEEFRVVYPVPPGTAL